LHGPGAAGLDFPPDHRRTRAIENCSVALAEPRLDRIRYAARAIGAISRQPYEGLERVLERTIDRAEARWHAWRYVPTDDAERRLHELVGAPWPCAARGEFDDAWRRVTERLLRQDVKTGRGAFGGWDDADSGFARVTFCLARHLRPEAVVETGVARGLTSSLILDGLERSGRGRLWSIDLPPLIDVDLVAETASAVGVAQRGRWTFLRGSSRRLLPGLVAGLGGIDLFVHDSMHTTRNVRFELDTVWPVLAPGGVAVVDDVERGRGFAAFTRAHPEAPAVVLYADDRRAMFGCVMKPGAP
jgi:hypothetical protein